MATKTLAEIRKRVAENLNDYIGETVTTALAASTSLISTALLKYTNKDDYFNRWHVIPTSLANIGDDRKVSDYVAATGTITVLGGNFTSDGAGLATFELYRNEPDNYMRAINIAARDLRNFLYRRIEWDDTLKLGNWLPNSHFEDWAATTAPDKWAVTNATAVATTTAGYYRGGTKSAKVSATAANGYMYCSGLSTWPRLLDLAGKTVSVYAWVYPEEADDATIVIYTASNDGTTTQTLTSTTSCAAGKWTRIVLENQVLNTDLNDVQIRLKVTTNAKYVYFDDVRLVGPAIYEYLLPTSFQNGKIEQVLQQVSGSSGDICDDVSTNYSQVVTIHGWRIYQQAGINFIRFPYASSTPYKIILMGEAPLEDNLSADTSTMTIDDPHLQLLAAYACFKLLEMEMGPISSEDTDKVAGMANYWRGQAEMMKHTLGMPRKQSTINFGR